MIPSSYKNWKFEKILGAGGFGQVELWRNKYTDKKIAIKKCMLPKDSITEKQMDRWKREIENMKNFKHPNIVCAELVPQEIIVSSPVLCMEFCNKGDLRRMLNKPEYSCGLLQDEVLTVMKNISSALKYLHYNNITHRDLKPENIVLHEREGTIIYKLIDLGYAKELGNKTTTASLVGTFNYVAPELFWKKKYTCSVDYWGLGILFFEVLTGYRPFIPYLENLINWMKFMKNKNYEEICAKEKLDGGIEFFDHVIYPNDFSSTILQKFVEWFRVALQWDPRQRGKQPHSSNVVIFSLLKNILPCKVVLIFFISSYKIDQFRVDDSTTFNDLQEWIQENSSITIYEQTIADAKGNILNNDQIFKRAILKDVLKSKILYVYKNNSLEINDTANSLNLPEILSIMLNNPYAIKDRTSLRQCYSALIYVMRNEIMLFEQYIFAFSTKLDIMNSKLETFNQNLQKSLAQLDCILNEFNLQLMSSNDAIKHSTIMGSISYNHDQLNKIKFRLTQLSYEVKGIENFIIEMQKIFETDNVLQNLEKFSKIYEDFQQLFLLYEKDKRHSSDYIMEQINILSEIYTHFIKQKMLQIQDPQIFKVAREFGDFEKMLNLLLEEVDSSVKSAIVNRNQIIELLNKHNQPEVNDNPLNQVNYTTENPSSNAFHPVMDNLFSEMQQNFLRMTEDFQDIFIFPK